MVWLVYLFAGVGFGATIAFCWMLYDECVSDWMPWNLLGKIQVLRQRVFDLEMEVGYRGQKKSAEKIRGGMVKKLRTGSNWTY